MSSVIARHHNRLASDHRKTVGTVGRSRLEEVEVISHLHVGLWLPVPPRLLVSCPPLLLSARCPWPRSSRAPGLTAARPPFPRSARPPVDLPTLRRSVGPTLLPSVRPPFLRVSRVHAHAQSHPNLNTFGTFCSFGAPSIFRGPGPWVSALGGVPPGFTRAGVTRTSKGEPP